MIKMRILKETFYIRKYSDCIGIYKVDRKILNETIKECLLLEKQIFYLFITRLVSRALPSSRVYYIDSQEIMYGSEFYTWSGKCIFPAEDTLLWSPSIYKNSATLGKNKLSI